MRTALSLFFCDDAGWSGSDYWIKFHRMREGMPAKPHRLSQDTVEVQQTGVTSSKRDVQVKTE